MTVYEEEHAAGGLIVIEGPDGSGKATQARLLTEALAAEGRPVMKVSFPDYDSQSSALVKMYLAGELGTDPSDVNAFAASTFYAVDRYVSYKQKWKDFYENGGIIVADRYTTSNAIHQCAKLIPEEWDDYLEWLFTFEYELMGIPAPDVVIYLRTDGETSQKLMDHRYEGDESKKDIHESNRQYLEQVRLAADYCARLMGWEVVESAANGELRSKEDIHQEILVRCSDFLRLHQ